MVIAAFQVVNKLGCSQFFQETFLLADISMKVIVGMRFFNLSNVDIQFAEKKLIWRTYITEKVLLTTRQVKIINRKKHANAALEKNVKVFVVHVSSLKLGMNIHSTKEAQFALLLIKEVSVLVKSRILLKSFCKSQQTYSQNGLVQINMQSSQKRASKHPIGPSRA